MNTKTTNILLLCIIAIAAILRLIHPFNIPYTYDELSALSRTHFNSFSELIDKGIIIDGHPAGVQVFLYYWTKLFGYTEIVVKLPFILMGIASVYYMFRIGQTWFNSTVGLVCAAYLATLEYPIMYSQLIRPYSAGLFFSLAMVYYWHKTIFTPNEKPIKHLVLYILFSSLCAYTHHFSLLFAVTVGLTGLFFVQKKHVIKYMLAGIIIFILYIPHLHIFFYQLNHGGIGGSNGWLSAPTYKFAYDYIHYVFQFSKTVSGLAIILFAFGVYNSFSKAYFNKKYLFISLSWFLLPMVIGFLYSVYINPVLQYSMLLFSFPFLLFFLFGLLPELNSKFVIPLLVIISLVNIYSLTHTRKYYQLSYKAPYEQPILVNDSLKKVLGATNYSCILQTEDSDKYVTDYYIHKDHADSLFYKASAFGCYITHVDSYVQFINFIKQQNKPYMGFGCTSQFDPALLQIISTQYPYMIKKWDFFDASFFLFSNTLQSNKIDMHSFESKNNFEKPIKYWSLPDTNFTHDTIHFSGKHAYKMDNKHEWGPVFSCKLGDMSWGKNDIITISLELFPLDTIKDVSIVSSLELNGVTLEWSETEVSKFIPDTLRKGWVKVYHSIKLQDITGNISDALLKVYIWNKGIRKFYMDDFEVKTFKGNPIIYGLMEKI
jgi:hypothetical protein